MAKNTKVHPAFNHLDIESSDSAVDKIEDGRPLKRLILGLPEARFKEMTEMLKLTPDLGQEQMRQKILHKEREWAENGRREHAIRGVADAEGATHSALDASTRPQCGHCGKFYHTEDKCWELHPELVPPAVKERREQELKRDTTTQINDAESTQGEEAESKGKKPSYRNRKPRKERGAKKVEKAKGVSGRLQCKRCETPNVVRLDDISKPIIEWTVEDSA